MRYTASVAVIVLAATAGFAAQRGAQPPIIISPRAPACIRFGVQDLRQALTATAGKAAAPAPAAPATLHIGEPATDELIRRLVQRRQLRLPEPPGSFCIKQWKHPGGRSVVIAGRDAVGAMYGAFEAAEQIRNMPRGADALAAIKETTQSPYLRIRAVNPFLHTEALADRQSWFYSPEFWETYLGILARSRFNLLDLHGAYQLVRTDFPNIFPYLVQSEQFPAVGVPAGEKRRNLEMLKRIVKMAKDRGIMVGLMSYKASWAIPPKESFPYEETEEALAKYHTEVVRKLIQQIPDLAFIGFRIGESGRKAGFYECYLQGVKEAGTPINIYTRSWLTDHEQLRSLAARCRGQLLVEIKYNGEHLGAPYQVAGNKMAGAGKYGFWRPYGYEDFTDVPRDYQIIWQVRANGTHRVFKWGDPEFVRRCARTFTYCGGVGFSIEPMTAYYPPADVLHWPQTDHRYYRWMHERDWFWYMLWGRLSYNPDLPDEVWQKAFQRHFGPEVGPIVVEGFTAASKVVPLIYSTHCLGPDHRNMAPELETGGSLLDFANTGPFDDSVIQSPAEHVENLVSGRASGKASPLEMAARLESAGTRGRELLESALRAAARRGTGRMARNEMRCLLEDARALEQLALYYADKLRAATEMELALRAGETGRLGTARRRTDEAHRHWDKLAQIGKRHYRPFRDCLRMLTTSFTWEREGDQHLWEDYVALDHAAAALATEMSRQGSAPLLRHIRVSRLSPGQALTISAIAAYGAGDVEVSVLFRQPGEQDFQQQRLSHVGQALIYRAVPLRAPFAGTIEYYLEARAGGQTVRLPSEAPERVFDVPITDDEQPPVVRSMQAQRAPGADKATVTAVVEDQSPLSFVRLWYRPLPSMWTWESVEMTKRGGAYVAEVPLTAEGLLYRVEAADIAGNATQAPDFRKEPPYRAIEPFVASKAGARPGRTDASPQ